MTLCLVQFDTDPLLCSELSGLAAGDSGWKDLGLPLTRSWLGRRPAGSVSIVSVLRALGRAAGPRGWLEGAM